RRRNLEAGLGPLAVVSGTAVLLGLLGTSLGLMAALSTTDAANVNAASLGEAAAAALAMTAFGLVTLIPARLALAVHRRDITNVERNLGIMGGLVLALMRSTRRLRRPAAPPPLVEVDGAALDANPALADGR